MQAPSRNPKPLDHLIAADRGDAPALSARFGTLSYAALNESTGRVADGLLERGLNIGDRVAAWLPKTRMACILPLACARAGLIYVPINPLLKRAQVAHIMADSGARLLITGTGRAETLEPADIHQGRLYEGEEDGLMGGSSLPLSVRNPSELVEILYTSGSTGRPKGVMLSHANLWLGAQSVAHYLKLTPADRVLGVLPFSFDYGQSQLLSTWAAGACAVPMDYLTPRDVIKAVDRYDISTLAGVPPLWVQLAEAEWAPETARRLKRLTNSGGAIPLPLVRKLRALFSEADLYLMYGLTEAFRSTYLDPVLVDSHPAAMGKAIPFAEIMIVRPNGSEAADGEPGELVHAGPLVAQGYWNDPKRTAERFKPAPPGSKEGGIAVFSGDSAVRDADGLLSFVARADEMIKTSGNRVSPTEIEEAAIGTGAVSEAVAIGIADPRLGQAILLVARPTISREDAEARLLPALKAEVPGYMLPARVLLLDTMPRNPNGKLDRAAIKRDYAS